LQVFNYFVYLEKGFEYTVFSSIRILKILEYTNTFYKKKQRKQSDSLAKLKIVEYCIWTEGLILDLLAAENSWNS
jgi:hypothetical protein